MEENWIDISELLIKFRNIFNIDKDFEINQYKSLYFWCYEFVMTRCYGWSLPSTVLVPLADFFNHNKDGVNHFLVHKKFEEIPKNKHENYIIKKNKSNFEIFKNENMMSQEKFKKDWKIDYINKNYVRIIF